MKLNDVKYAPHLGMLLVMNLTLLEAHAYVHAHAHHYSSPLPVLSSGKSILLDYTEEFNVTCRDDSLISCVSMSSSIALREKRRDRAVNTIHAVVSLLGPLLVVHQAWR